MRKIVIIFLVAMLCAGGVAFAAWRIIDDGGDEGVTPAVAESDSFQVQLEETISGDEVSGEETASTGSADVSSVDDPEAVDNQTGEDFSYTTPDQRYVTETQRHQNFFKAVAEGRVRRLEVTSTDVRPVGDSNTSYVYFTLITTSGASNGTMVMKFESGMWRIAAVNQLSGDLAGGTNYVVPEEFDAVLGREIAELQPFLTQMAEGRFAYMEVYSTSYPSASEAVLTGVVAGKGGSSVPAEMRLQKDYGIWHLTYITNPP